MYTVRSEDGGSSLEMDSNWRRGMGASVQFLNLGASYTYVFRF